MLKTGILNPAIQSLLCRVRHTNRLVLADRGFPSWPDLETVDITLVDDIPTVPQVLAAILKNFQVGGVWMAAEFLDGNNARREPLEAMLNLAIQFEPHIEFKRRVPGAIGLIRTADTTPYANMILESA